MAKQKPKPIPRLPVVPSAVRFTVEGWFLKKGICIVINSNAFSNANGACSECAAFMLSANHKQFTLDDIVRL